MADKNLYPEHFHKIIYIEQNKIFQNLSNQDICFNSIVKEVIDLERNATNLFDQHDSKGQTPSISSQEGSPIDLDIPLARTILNKLPECPALLVPTDDIWNILDKICVPIHVSLHALSIT
jgi:hypothetical protein